MPLVAAHYGPRRPAGVHSDERCSNSVLIHTAILAEEEEPMKKAGALVSAAFLSPAMAEQIVVSNYAVIR